MAFPIDPLAVTVEAFYSGAWQDITSYVYLRDGIGITRGYTANSKACDPGKLKLTLNNRDGRFSPRNPVSPLYGLIGRNTPIRVKVTHAAVTYIRFVGEVTSWPSRWDVSERDVWVPLEAAGILRRLGKGEKPLRSPLFRSIQSSTPAEHWPLTDGTTATVGANLVSGGAVMAPVGEDPVWAGFPGPLGEPGQVVSWSDTDANNRSASLSAAVRSTATTSWAAEFAFNAEETTGIATDGLLFLIHTTGAPWYLFAQGDDPAFVLQLDVQGHIGEAAAHREDYASQWHHYVVTAVQNGANVEAKLYYDGQLLLSGSAAFTLGTPTRVTVNATPGLETPGPVNMAACNVAFYNSASDVDVANRYQAFLAWAAATADDRFATICQHSGTPYAVTGTSTALMAAEREGTLLQGLRDAVDVDQALFFELRDELGVQMRTNSSRYNQTPIELDYAAGHIAPPLDPEPDDQQVANDREVKRRNGSSARRELTVGALSTQDPPNGVGRYDDTITVEAYSDTQLPFIASHRLWLGTWDAERYPSVHVDLAAAPDLIPDITAADTGDLLTIANLPAWLPPGNAELAVAGYAEKLGLNDWDITFACWPGGPFEVGVAGDGVTVSSWAQTAGTELMVARDDNDTSLMVHTSGKRKWDTSFTNQPVIEMGGETMTLTAVSNVSPAFVAAGTAAHGNNASVQPALPAGLTDGDLLLVLAAIRNSGTGTPGTHVDYQLLADIGNVKLLGKYAEAGETAPTITFTGGVAGADTTAQCAAFRGVGLTVHNLNTLLNTSAQDIAYPALDVTQDNCLVLYLGWKQDDWTSVATVGTAEIGEPDTATGDDQGLAWGYTLQTAATPIAAGSFTVTGGASAISRGAVVALKSNVQNLTVTRSENGVAKSHNVGAAIRVHRPLVATL